MGKVGATGKHSAAVETCSEHRRAIAGPPGWSHLHHPHRHRFLRDERNVHLQWRFPKLIAESSEGFVPSPPAQLVFPNPPLPLFARNWSGGVRVFLQLYTSRCGTLPRHLRIGRASGRRRSIWMRLEDWKRREEEVQLCKGKKSMDAAGGLDAERRRSGREEVYRAEIWFLVLIEGGIN
ncbi:unnamed protein product [Linum trigynum]|uniref:Uncharacterized protein n=1 Tax=Linum trigynum TaxID=586398 RepID=A0AAV2G8T1_9ROSI